jgi:hypothetical protein
MRPVDDQVRVLHLGPIPVPYTGWGALVPVILFGAFAIALQVLHVWLGIGVQWVLYAGSALATAMLLVIGSILDHRGAPNTLIGVRMKMWSVFSVAIGLWFGFGGYLLDWLDWLDRP